MSVDNHTADVFITLSSTFYWVEDYIKIMKSSKKFRFNIVLSIIWMLIAFPSFWVINIKIINNDRDAAYAVACASISGNKSQIEECKSEMNVIFSRQVDNNASQSIFFTFASLALFWLLVFLRNVVKRWVNNGT